MRGYQEKGEKSSRGVGKRVRVRIHQEVLGRELGLGLQFHPFLGKQ